MACWLSFSCIISSHATPFSGLFWVCCAAAEHSALAPGKWKPHYWHFLPKGRGQLTGKLPKRTPASQELTEPLSSCPSLGAPLPPSSCSQQAEPGPGSHAAVLLPGELGGKSELCREKARPVKVSEMTHHGPCAAGLRCISALVLCLRIVKPSEVQGHTHYSLVRGS